MNDPESVAASRRLFVFDLDGTILDSLSQIADSVNRLRADHDLAPLERPAVQAAIGKGARALLAKICPEIVDALGVEPTYAAFVEHYRVVSERESRLYDQGRELLEWLAARGTPAAILTNKPREITRVCIASLGIAELVSAVVCPEDATAKPDPAGLVGILDALEVDAGDTVMVGDSENDYLCARAAGVVSVGLRTGYGPHGAGPDEWFDSVPALYDAVRAAGPNPSRSRGDVE